MVAKLIATLFAGLLTVYCSKSDQDEKAGPNGKIEELKKRYEEKLKEAKEKFDQETGWPSKDDCDATLWAGLAKASGVNDTKLLLAEYSPGEIHRRPGRPCYEDGKDVGSKSTVSRDMLLGYLYGLWRSGERDSVRRLAAFGESNAWIMGKPTERVGEVLLTGNLIGLLGRMQCKLDLGCPVYSKIPPLYTKPDADYVRHLTVLFVLLQGEVNDSDMSYDDSVASDYPSEVVTMDISRSERRVLQELHQADRGDALLEAAFHLYEDGDFSAPLEKLLGSSYAYPSYVRGSDNYKIVHWLFTADLILRRYK